MGQAKEQHFCVACGEKASCRYQGNMEWYCNKHYLRMYNNGTLAKKKRPRTNTYEICEDKISILTKKGQKILIDAEDFAKVNQWSWCVNKKGYAVANVQGKVQKIHMLILGPRGITDHINGNKLDNRKQNLRKCSAKENARNSRVGKNNSTGYVGIRVTPKSRYKVRIMVNRKEIHLGVFDDLQEALRARHEGELRYFGEFAPCLGANSKVVLQDGD